MSRPRVVITGLSAITPLGNDLETPWKRLLAGESGIGPITLFDATDYDSRVAGEVKDFVAEDFIPAKQARRMDRFTQFAVVAAQQLLKDSGLVINDDNAYDVGVILGIGLGGSAVFGAMFHAVRHSLTKCMLFLLAGNVLTRYRTLACYDVHGMRWTMPITGALWTAGFLAIVGSPPFGLFVSEFLILKGILSQGRWLVACCYLLALGIIFVGMSVPVLHMVQGTPPDAVKKTRRESMLSVLPPFCLGLLVLGLGIYTPAWLENLLARAAALIGG